MGKAKKQAVNRLKKTRLRESIMIQFKDLIKSMDDDKMYTFKGGEIPNCYKHYEGFYNKGSVWKTLILEPNES